MKKKESEPKKVEPKKKIAKTATKKISKKPAKKLAAAAKKKTTKEAKIKKPVKKSVKTTKEKAPLKKKVAKAPKTAKAEKKEIKEIAIPKKKVAVVPQRTIKKVAANALISKRGLPAEYGEDRITLMLVDPWKLFAYWEVRKDTLSRLKGELGLRVYDVTGIYFDGKNANTSFDLPVSERIGDSYIGAAPARVFIVDIGVILKAGGIITIARSNKVATPSLKVSKEEGMLPEEIYGGGEPSVGYF